jgi:hypothetical protein
MYYLVNVDHNSMAVILKGFKKCCISNAVEGTDEWWCCRMTVKRVGMLGVSVRKRKALIVRMGTVTLIGKGR